MIQIHNGRVSKRTWTHQGRTRSAFRYSVTVIEDGVRRIYRKQFFSRAEAQSALDALKAELRAPKPVAATATITLAQACETYLAEKRDKRTIEQMRKTVANLLAALGADVPLEELTVARINAYKRDRQATIRRGMNRTLTAAAVNRPLALLRAVLRLAADEKHIAEVPKIKTVKEPEGRLRWLDPAEANRLLAACRASKNADLVDYVELSLFTGMRQGEVLELTWDRIDFGQQIIYLELTKSGKRRAIPMNANSYAVLTRRGPKSEGRVFTHHRWDHYRTAWEFAYRRAQIPRSDRTAGFRPHDLRHCYASWLAQRGASQMEIKDLLGHATLAMSARYTHLAPKQLRVAAARLDGILDVPARAQAEHMDSAPFDPLAPTSEKGQFHQ